MSRRREGQHSCQVAQVIEMVIDHRSSVTDGEKEKETNLGTVDIAVQRSDLTGDGTERRFVPY